MSIISCIITHIVCCQSFAADVRAQVERLRYEANEFAYKHGYAMPVHVLANRMADLCQVYTQEASNRAMACVMILIGHDDEKGKQYCLSFLMLPYPYECGLFYFYIFAFIVHVGPQVLKVDAAGHFLPYKAVAAGKSEQEAMNFMEKRVDELAGLDEHGCVEMAISAMQYVLSTDFKGTLNDEKLLK